MNPTETRPECSHNTCSRPLYAKGLCKPCYNKKLREDAPARVCTAKDCDRSAQSGRYCASHYRRRRNGEMGMPIRGHNQVGCLIVDCGGDHHALGVCQRHYRGGRIDESKAGGDFRHHNLLWKYRITQAERDQMFADQDDLCACCQDQPAVAVDHDHSHDCGADPKRGCRECVRGGLCSRCNTALAFVEDARWRAMADLYLARPRPFAGTPDPTISPPPPEKPFAAEIALLKELGLR